MDVVLCYLPEPHQARVAVLLVPCRLHYIHIHILACCMHQMSSARLPVCFTRPVPCAYLPTIYPPMTLHHGAQQ